MTDTLIAGGGTGGHLFPGIAVAQELRRRDAAARILFVGTRRGIEVRAVPKAGFELALLPVAALRGGGLAGLLLGLARLPWALWRALRLVRAFRPQIAVSVGGYAAGPAVLASRLLGVPTVVMEQNALPGWTNRVLARLARRVLAGLPVAGLPPAKVKVLGNPVRHELLAVGERPYAPHRPARLLVFGGSQGARALNQVMTQVVPRLRLGGVAVEVVHQTGEAELATVRDAYRAAGVQVDVRPFIDDMATAYADADLVLCRSGAMTLAELGVCGRPAILVPFPFAVDDHQTANARIFADAGAAVLLPQQELEPVRLTTLLGELLADPARLATMAAAAKGLGRPRAVVEIADALVEEVRHV